MRFSNFILILSFFSIYTLNAQHKDYKLDWTNKKNMSAEEEEKFYVPGFSDSNFDFIPEKGIIEFNAQWEESGDVSSSTLTNISYEPISEEHLKNLNTDNIPEEPKYNLKSARGGNTGYLTLNLSPIIKEQGIYKKIVSFRIEYSLNNNITHDSGGNNVPGISHSVLSTGDIYKFSVEKTGVYKLSKRFLKDLGMDADNIALNKIKIYGHGGEMLPLQNDKNLFYDPPEVPLQIVGGENGNFGNDDYILFYAIGTEGNYNSESDTYLNLYADEAFYYITADGDNGKRVTDYQQPDGGSTTTITSFQEEDFYEVDETNIGKVGRRWFGDKFDVTNERTYNFNFPNIVQDSDIEIKIHAAAASEFNTSFNAQVNNQNIGNLSFGAINSSLFAQDAQLKTTTPAGNDAVEVKLTYNNNGNPSSIAYLNYIGIKAERALKADNKQFAFSYADAENESGIGRYQIENTQNISQIWEVTDPYNISSLSNEQNSSIDFKANLGEKKKYIAISPNDYYTPNKVKNPKISNIDLKGNIFNGPDGNTQDVDYLIITSEKLKSEATRLAQHRSNQDGLKSKVVTVEDIYEEFNSGKQDIGAIRNFVKYVYDNASSSSNRLKYLLLFGHASIDYKNRLDGNNNIVPTYQSMSSYSLSSSSFASDDFFGMMDDDEGTMESSDKLDIAVGRILAEDQRTAKLLVDKTINYNKEQSFGSWRNNFILISDDVDEPGAGGAGLQQSLDDLGDEISDNKPFINVKKIHSDAYEQVYTSGGERYPEVNKAITENIEVGATVVNYFGHGGEEGLASEYIVTRDDIEGWKNDNKHNVFITVTCEFTRFDNPLRLSPGELALYNEEGGSIGLVTTTRLIPVSTGTTFNNLIAPYLFNFDEQNYTVAEAVRRAKNDISSSARRVVFFFGDPAMHLALPDPEIKLTAINEHPIDESQDTLKALQKVKLSGEVVSPNGTLLENFNGSLTATVHDKPIERQTLGNDGTTDNSGELIIMDFKTLGNTIFRGKASVKNGKFDFEFVVPKDIKMPVDHGRVSFYSKESGALKDYKGYDNSILVGDIDKNAPEDNKGPEIQLYMNDDSFVSGGITDNSPLILAELEDENGINTTSGIGHDIIAYIDGDETDAFVLNDYYQAEEDDFTKGKVNYKLHDLEKGPHTLTFKAWDVYNNSSEEEVQFVVTEEDELKIDKVLNYPNPFTDYTEFWFNHNRPFEPLEVQVQVFTVSGKVVWTKNEIVNTEGFLSRDIKWDGKDDFGDAIGKGVYVYKLSVKSTVSNKKVEKYEKLVIL